MLASLTVDRLDFADTVNTMLGSYSLVNPKVLV
jgi:hypothetical protein